MPIYRVVVTYLVDAESDEEARGTASDMLEFELVEEIDEDSITIEAELAGDGDPGGPE